MDMRETRLMNLQLKSELDYLVVHIWKCMDYLADY